MVWSQYVYEATTGFDSSYASEEDDYDDTPLNIHDWEVKYSEELTHMWNTTKTLMEDALIAHTGEYWDFVDFCFREHNTRLRPVVWEYQEQTMWYEERLAHVWRNIRRIVHENGLHEEMIRGASFYDFAYFAKNFMRVY
jgi:hypothetical protein